MQPRSWLETDSNPSDTQSHLIETGSKQEAVCSLTSGAAKLAGALPPRQPDVDGALLASAAPASE
jgi:hypothetical protein